ncbi:MAG TPA: alpha-amylase family glycosyl hydrolase [Candidatus Limnocylindrales bacterium]|nr:alpha-amylase family glycosyl hydrolase [Candidatus Limnocylindrales bacterium]
MAFEFHVSKAARERYEFEEALFESSGNVIIPNFPASRRFASQMNDRRDPKRDSDRVVHAAELNAMGLIDEILHHAVEIYRRTVNPNAMAGALAAVVAQLQPDRLDQAIAQFVEQFPPLAVHRGRVDPVAYLSGSTEGIPNRELALEELLMLWLANANPAFAPFDELFDDSDLSERTPYEEVIASLSQYFEAQPGYGPMGLSLIAFLRTPALAEPNSLAGQLRYIRSRWGLVLTPFLDRLGITLDVLHEEEVAPWMTGQPGGGLESAIHTRGRRGLENEYERFSQDREWMPRVVIIARTTFVWLDQLSERYGREIRQLDDIPDEELEALSRRGFTALWLIGLWERSHASRRIKELRGNPDAAASAYSLMEYRIADELGGEAALERLRDRCAGRGIRLSADMVPNHMGIDSHWVIEHPDWFVQLPQPPYSHYTFMGPNLSEDKRVTIQIEDGYWDSTGAAVVFKRTDNKTGEVRYIYHGNDGTSMPWNDTAQLDFLNADLREAVIQTILQVARQFPIIRCDAAMALARRHIQRLWFPEAGQTGAIPSREDYPTPRAVFDEHMPNEFWREVVDRVAAEAPDTLLLAEAFWLMESYFVRTLGMHRVYNSAFMHMLSDEDNASYRQVIKDTIELDPEVLKRFVNFMTNPDEQTAVDQFGKGDKYFGVCTVLATMPGLPMMGHGQVEGFAEKYGMEYRRAHRHEQPDGWLVERHEREIFPLLHRRYLFAEVTDFLFFDVFDSGGWVNEDIFAYSNRHGDERALVVYNNRATEAKGWIRMSAASSVPDGSGGRQLIRRSLGEGLGLHPEGEWFTLMREQRSGLEFVRRSADLCRDGLFVELNAYGCHVFLDIREVQDEPSGQLRRLAERLGGAGVPSISVALRETQLAPLHEAVRGLAASGSLRRLTEIGAMRAAAACPSGALGVDLGLRGPNSEGQEAARVSRPAHGQPEPRELQAVLDDAQAILAKSLNILVETTGPGGDVERAAADFRAGIEAALRLPELGQERLCAGLMDEWAWVAIVGRLISEAIASAAGTESARGSSLDELKLGPAIAGVFSDLGLDEGAAWGLVALMRVFGRLPLPSSVSELPAADRARTLIRTLVTDEAVRAYLRVNIWEGVNWFNRESFGQALWWMFALDALQAAATPGLSKTRLATRLAQSKRLTSVVARAGEVAEYQLDRLEDAARA